MLLIQELTVKMAIAIFKGLMSNIKKIYYYSIIGMNLILVCCVPAIILNLVSDHAAIGTATHLAMHLVSFC